MNSPILKHPLECMFGFESSPLHFMHQFRIINDPHVFVFIYLGCNACTYVYFFSFLHHLNLKNLEMKMENTNIKINCLRNTKSRRSRKNLTYNLRIENRCLCRCCFFFSFSVVVYSKMLTNKHQTNKSTSEIFMLVFPFYALQLFECWCSFFIFASYFSLNADYFENIYIFFNMLIVFSNLLPQFTAWNVFMFVATKEILNKKWLTLFWNLAFGKGRIRLLLGGYCWSYSIVSKK